jgi:very-short-patch-repair endonuclease/predicted nucleic acid-binding Zn ribbon protein
MQTKLKLILEYIENPNYCHQCGISLTYDNKNYKFCSCSCSATYNNSNKSGPTQETKDKISSALLGKKLICPISWCVICGTLIKNKRSKTCSKDCKSKLVSRKMKSYISITPSHKLNRNPYKQSYMERSFEEWLKSKGMTNSLHGYLMEVKFFNPYTNKWGRADFVFPKKKLIIELDGTHHLEPKRKALDVIRDAYLCTRGWDVIRVSHKEYKNKSKEQIIINSLF